MTPDNPQPATDNSICRYASGQREEDDTFPIAICDKFGDPTRFKLYCSQGGEYCTERARLEKMEKDLEGAFE